MGEEKNYDLIVIGGGPAGITLAKKLGPNTDMAVIRPEDYSLIYCAMPYVIEGLIPINKVFKKDELVTDANADLIKDYVKDIDFDNKSIKLSDGSRVGYNRLIIATGAKPFVPPIEGSSLNGVLSFKTQEDLDTILDFINSNESLKHAVIVGAGAIGIELAQALRSTGIEVSLVDMEKSILPSLIDSEMAELPAETLIKNGIHAVLNAKVVKISGSGYIENIYLDNGKVINFDDLDKCSINGGSSLNRVLVFSIGMAPDISFIKDKRLKTGRGGISVNEKMETSIKDVYACGDCVEFKSGITGKITPGKLATNAVTMAKVLASNLLGEDDNYPGFYNGAATKVYDYFIGGTGLTETEAKKQGIKTIVGHSQLTTQFPIMPEAKKLMVKLIAKKDSNILIGGQIVSGEPVTGQIDLLTFAIQKKTKIKDLTRLSYSAQPYQSFFPAANAIILAAEDLLKKA